MKVDFLSFYFFNETVKWIQKIIIIVVWVYILTEINKIKLFGIYILIITKF